MADYSKSSPYYDTSSYGNFLDIMNKRTFPMQVDDVQVTLTEAYRNRPDLLAYDLYQDSRLWWVFAVRNPNTIKDSVFDFVPGLQIFVPNKQNLTTALGI
jgi:hypothetical protein